MIAKKDRYEGAALIEEVDTLSLEEEVRAHIRMQQKIAKNSAYGKLGRKNNIAIEAASSVLDYVAMDAMMDALGDIVGGLFD